MSMNGGRYIISGIGTMATVFAMAFTLTINQGRAADWPCYHGVNGDCHTEESVTEWPPQELWRAHVGDGFSQIVVSDGKVYTMGWSSGQNQVWCFAENSTGTDPTPVWKSSYAQATEGNNQGAYKGTYSTPAVDGTQVYTIDNFGNFNCWSTTNGALLWSSSAFSGNGADWAASPFVEGDLVLVNGGTVSGVSAISKSTHSVVWGAPGTRSRYTSPFATTIGGQRVIIGYGSGVNGVDPASGTSLWNFPLVGGLGDSIANPQIINGNQLFASQGYNGGCALVNLGGSGTLTAVYNHNTSLCTKENSPVYYGGYIYGIDENTGLKCIDPATGNVKWSAQSSGAHFSAESAVLSASNQIIVLTGAAVPFDQANNGNLVVVQATSTAYTELHRASAILSSETFTVPTLCNGQLYVRGLDGTVICYKVGEPPPPPASGFKMKIQFSGYTPAAPNTMTNFPAMVVFSNNMNNTAFDYSQMASTSGDDLRFFSWDQSQELNYEIDEWNPNGASYVWVQVPTIASTNDYIWATWGGKGLTKPAYTTDGSTWDASSYVGVWHMREAVTNGGIIHDSTSLHNDGVWNATGTSAAGVPGKIGNCIHVNGGGGLMVTDNTSLHVLQQTTFSVWGKSDNPTATGWYGEMMSKRGDLTITPHPGNPSSEIMFANYDGPSGRLGSYCGPAEVPTLDITQWSYWTGVLNANSGDQYVYFNGWCDMQYNQGTFVGGGPMHRSNAVTTMGPGGNLWFGTNPGGNTSGQLMMDEARMEKVPRASNWVWSCYMTMASNSTFQTYNTIVPVGSTTGVVYFASSTYSGAENGGPVTIRVLRDNGASGVITVNFATGGGTATPGADYVATNGTLSFGMGKTSLTFTVSMIDDALTEPNETFNITLSGITGTGILGNPSTAVFTIMDDDGPGSFQFSSSSGYAVSQDAGTMAITVARANGKTGAASVSYATSDGTAANGVNYTTTSGTLNFANNETSKTFNVSIINAPVGNGKTVNLALSNPTGGATLSAPSTSVLTIVPPGPFSVWSHKMNITFPGYNSAQTLTNFPVLLVLTNNAGGVFNYSQVLAAGADLRFSDCTNAVPLNYEIEKWVTNGPSYVWVQVPVMSNNCNIWAWWGKSDATAAPCTTNGATWDSSFKGVWHLGEASGAHVDSTAYRNAASGGTYGGTTGVVDGAATYSGAAYDTVNNSGSLNVTAGITFGAWVQYADAAGGSKNPFLIKGDNEIGNDFGFIYAVNNGTIWLCLNNGATGINFAPTLNTWCYIMGTYDQTTVRAYVNGRQTASWASSSAINNSYASACRIAGGTWGKLNGKVDECRIMSAAVSSNWIWTSYVNMASNDTFCCFTNNVSTGGNAPLGTPIAWLVSHGLTGNPATDELSDPNGDHVLAWQDYILGTDPSGSNNGLKGTILRTANGLVITFPGPSASGSDYTGKTRHYVLEGTMNLLAPSWQAILNYSNVTGNDVPVVYTNAVPGSMNYYRTRAWLQ